MMWKTLYILYFFSGTNSSLLSLPDLSSTAIVSISSLSSIILQPAFILATIPISLSYLPRSPVDPTSVNETRIFSLHISWSLLPKTQYPCSLRPHIFEPPCLIAPSQISFQTLLLALGILNSSHLSSHSVLSSVWWYLWLYLHTDTLQVSLPAEFSLLKDHPVNQTAFFICHFALQHQQNQNRDLSALTWELILSSWSHSLRLLSSSVTSPLPNLEELAYRIVSYHPFLYYHSFWSYFISRLDFWL